MEFRAKTVRLPAWDLEFDVLADDSIIGPAIERGSWADHETFLFRAHLVPGSRAVDLGANVGWFAVQAILAGAEVHAFEPVPAIAELCERNMARAMKRGPGRGVLHRVAAGAARGRARIVLAPANHGDNRVVEAGAPAPRDLAEAESIEIDIAPVDEFVHGPARVVKIDTQGSEWLAIQGAQRLFAESPQMALLFEFWPYALRGARPEQLLDWLFAQGFTVGKATEAPYPMARERILRQVLSRDPVRGGIDLYATRGVPFHVASLKNRVRGFVRSLKED